MARDDDDHDADASGATPLPPEDRLWRHPSELAHGVQPPATWMAPAPQQQPRRRVAAAALAGACLTGVALACGVLWLARPSWVSDQAAAPPTTLQARPVVSYASAGVPTEDLALDLRQHLVHVEAKVGDTWVSGTGLWLDRGAAVLVAAPLVSGGAGAMVTGDDRRRRDATIVAVDDASGIALLSVVDPSSAPEVPSTAAGTLGEEVAVVSAITASGSAADQRAVPTSISAVGVRTAINGTLLHDALQLADALPSDALGAPVLDAEGHLVGIVVDTADDDGMAVAVPADSAIDIADDLASDGEVSRAWLGVEATDLDPDAAKLLGLDGGAHLTAVTADSPAADAGLQPDDVITEVAGLEVLDASDLVRAIRRGQPGRVVEVRWARGASSLHASVILGG